MVSLMSCAPGVVIRNSVKIVLNLIIIRLASLSWAGTSLLLVCNSAQASEEERDKTRRRGHSEISLVKNFYIILINVALINRGRYLSFFIYLSDK